MNEDRTTIDSLEKRQAFNDQDYTRLLSDVRNQFAEMTESGGKSSIFTTDADGLYEAYLNSIIDPVERQQHNCHTCKNFIRRFGSLVVIDEHGAQYPLLWPNDESVPFAYQAAVRAISRLIRRAKVTGAFLSSDQVWGIPVTGEWRHLSVTPGSERVFRNVVKTAGQVMAEKKEDFNNVMRSLDDFNAIVVNEAMSVLESEALYRSEKVIGPVKFLRDLWVAINNNPKSVRANLVWRAIASAPAGFCHPRSSMAGSLMEDIAAGMSFNDVSRRFAAKMHPLQYQRPQAAPKAGNIAEAEKIVEKLKAAGSLQRRFARLDEVESLWTPKAVTPPAETGGVFAKVRSKNEVAEPKINIPATVMTWRKFSETVMPEAERIEFFVPNRADSYTALVTAVNPESPPIIQWDSEDRRNPVSWYLWHGGSMPSSFGLDRNQFCEVDAITYKPSMWGGGEDRMSHQGKGVIFILRGARESRISGSALFPEILRAEFHGIRSVIEAYSRGEEIEGLDQPMACGIMLTAGTNTSWLADFRVTTKTGTRMYRLDRWD